jgi:hypothetical protein
MISSHMWMQEVGNHGIDKTMFSMKCNKTPRRILRRISARTSIGTTDVWKMLYVHDFQPRYLQRVGNILSTDHTSRVKFFERLQPRIYVLSFTLLTDEPLLSNGTDNNTNFSIFSAAKSTKSSKNYFKWNTIMVRNSKESPRWTTLYTGTFSNSFLPQVFNNTLPNCLEEPPLEE